jgi:hypothetical protein
MARTPITLHKIPDGFSKWFEFDGDVKFLCSPPTIDQHIYLRNLYITEKDEVLRGIRVGEYYLKFVIKDWEGMDEPCKIINDELDDRQWKELILFPEQTFMMVNVIQAEIEFKLFQKKN